MIVRARAPLRLGLAGGGTDVSPYSDLHGGLVMNATIDRYAYASVDASPTGRVEFHALEHDESGTWDIAELPQANGSLRLMGGAFARVVRDFLGHRASPVRIRTYSDAPAGSGLGSSSAMVVAIVTALAEYFALGMGEYEIAHLAFEIERGKTLSQLRC